MLNPLLKSLTLDIDDWRVLLVLCENTIQQIESATAQDGAFTSEEQDAASETLATLLALSDQLRPVASLTPEEEAMLDQVEDADLLERFRPASPLTRH